MISSYKKIESGVLRVEITREKRTQKISLSNKVESLKKTSFRTAFRFTSLFVNKTAGLETKSKLVINARLAKGFEYVVAVNTFYENRKKHLQAIYNVVSRSLTNDCLRS